MRMGGASAPPLCFLLLLNKKTFYKMGHFDELLVNKLELGGTVKGAKRQVLRQTVEGAARALSTNESGALVLLDKDEACAFTLPAIGSDDIGCNFTFIETVVSDTDRVIDTAFDNDYFVGGVTLNFDGASTDGTGTIAFVSTGGTDVQITFDDNLSNGAGGLGSQVTCTAVLAGNTAASGGAKLVWAVEGSMIAQAEASTGAGIFT